jgi:hypothetical protein
MTLEKEKDFYKIKLYPFTYKRIKKLMKIMNWDFDTALQTLMIIMDKRKLLQEYYAVQKIRKFEELIKEVT